MVFHPDVRARLEALLGPELMWLLDAYVATSPYAPEPLTRAEKHELNAKLWRSLSQARRARASNAVQAQKRRLEAIRNRPDFDPYK